MPPSKRRSSSSSSFTRTLSGRDRLPPPTLGPLRARVVRPPRVGETAGRSGRSSFGTKLAVSPLVGSHDRRNFYPPAYCPNLVKRRSA
jgi:hypothetical protein